MSNKTVVSRFAPSPTGRMHAGNIFSYLINWIETKRIGGKVLLRIENLDQQRSKRVYGECLMRDLEMLGLTWDGEVLFQSKRKKDYEEAFLQLSNRAELYPCFCTRADVRAASAPHAGEQIIYPGTCYALSATQRMAQEQDFSARHKHPSIRIHLPDETIAFTDVFQGSFKANLQRDCGDFILQRSDTGFSYNLAVVVDDAAQKVNFVVRGYDLLPITPQQIFLQHLLDIPQPTYAHVPLFVAEDGRRIAKRDHDASLDEMLAQFKSPEAILGHIAYCAGLIEYDEACTAEDLLSHASMDALRGRKTILWH